MTMHDGPDFDRDLTSSLESLAPQPAPGLLDGAMAEVSTTAQRSGSRLWAFASYGTAWPRWLAIGGVAAAAMVVGILIGSSRGLVTGDDPSPTPTSSVGPTASPVSNVWVEPAAYVFVFSSECGERNLIGTFEVTVEDGAVVTYQPMDERASAFPGGIDDLPTMGQLVGRAEDARLDPEAVLTLETDPSDGHPTLIDIDWLPNAMDDEECYAISRYAPYAAVSAPPNPSAGPAWTEPDSYVYVFDSQCGRRVLSGRWEVTVENGKAVDYHSPDHTGSLLAGIEVPTLADLMNQVERARADGDAIVKAFEADPDDGHPTLIDIDWLPNAVDDEECYVIESYTPTD